MRRLPTSVLRRAHRRFLLALPLLLVFSMPVWSQCLPEICDGLDNDCDGNLDEGCDRTCDQPTKYGGDTEIGGEAYSPSLVWQGSEYAAVGSNFISGGFGSETLFRRMSATGVPLGDLVTFGDRDGSFITSSGNEYAVVWGLFESTLLRFARLDSSGTLIGPETPLGDGVAYGIAWTGTGYGVALHDGGNHRLLRISPTGTIVGATSIHAGGSGRDFAWSGSEYGVLITDQDQAGTFQLYFARLDALGYRIGPMRQLSASATGTSGGSLVWASGEWGVAWQESVPGGNDVFFARIDIEGQRAGAVRRVTDQTVSKRPSLAWSGAEYAVSFVDSRDGHSEVYLARLDALGEPVGAHVRVTVTDSWDEAWRPAVAWSGTGYGIVYESWRGSGDPRLYFSIIGCPCHAFDTDGDLVSDCNGDCDANDGNVYPGAIEVCDGVSNDCLDDAWPRLPADWDNDGDGMTECQGDCNDYAAAAYAGALEVCDSLDNDCDTLIDEDASGEDTDGDAVGNLCDNCLFDANPTQSDVDLDAEGDLCDLNDGRIHIRFDDGDFVAWDPEGGYDAWNSYRGDIEVLRSRGDYTQKPQGSNPLAKRVCQLPGASPFVQDTDLPDSGKVAFYLTTGIAGGIESGLGTDSSGAARPNDNPCP